MQKKRILIVEDESTLRTALFRVLNRQGHQVVTAGSLKEARMLANADHPPDLALIDVHLPDGDGLQLMQDLKSQHQDLQVVVLTGHGSIEMAIDATRKGAFHFITKPFNLDELVSLTEKALTQSHLSRENKVLKAQLQGRYKFENIVGQSPEIRAVLDLVQRVSDSDASILIQGESGTGKELVAKALHYNSDRREKAFVPINCGAIPAELLESELFGHVKGAFTGAVNSRMGRFEMASGGTIFLDEIGDMSPALQVKLLRVLQERKFEPVGSNTTLETDVRVITATHIDLEKAVATGRFREDLYYRLNVIPIYIPALRNRSSDIPLLLSHFIDLFNQKKKGHLQGISTSALEILCHYEWPGNIRELENLIERISIIKRNGTIDVEDLPQKYKSTNASKSHSDQIGTSQIELPTDGMDFNSAVDAYENRLILQALEKTGWNRNQAASLLRLNRTTLVEKIKKKGLAPAHPIGLDV